ncbi:type I polyketide synthase [Chitinophaga sp. Cy-1792]|uniref:type I polyketide synthase n=1 Tax=Chitinophaga sp. Cy-1792 TaxID=2608339 RepID=UPI001421A376|nr:type I polyketide synthase [Chitinophaga sp. Cy-1792]NIG56681.1 AMP-binding protein [Chitinophaga sp. Cy-1792]
MEHTTIVDLISRFPVGKANEKALVFLDTNGNESTSYTYRSLKQQCITIAENLYHHLTPKEIVLLCARDQAEFTTAFFGCMMAGIIPAPMAPVRNSKDKSGMERIIRVLQQRTIRTMLIAEEQLPLFREAMQAAGLNDIQFIVLERLHHQNISVITLPEIAADDIAYIQYTSGSTSTPKGVIIRHCNAMRNLAFMYRTFQRSESVRVAGWLPFHHDMGLIGHLLTVLFEHGFGVFISPQAFMATPALWLKIIGQYQANAAAAPPFAFDLCCSKISTTEGLQLSSWKYAYVGAETVSPEILLRFADKFKSSGFDINAFKPVYGLAEATLLAAGGAAGLDELLPLTHTRNTGNSSRSLLPYRTDPEVVISIHDISTGDLLEDGAAGEIYIQGSGNSSGYLEDKATAGITDTTLLKTGDTGFLQGGHLYITGRTKDIIIVRGVNYAANDLESCIRYQQPDLATNDRTVCITYFNTTEELIVFQEIHRHTDAAKKEQLIAHIKGSLAEGYGIIPDNIVLVPSGCIPRTSSYKISRKACLDSYLEGTLPIISDTLHTADTMPAPANDDVVIVAMACRFPGADSPEAFWELLQQGTDAISEVPASRWENDVFYDEKPAVPGKVNTRWGGFVTDIDQFDPALFGISPYEAPEIDPQQRLLMETSWRLLENAGWKKESLAGSDTGVFLGVSTNDYLYMKIKLIPGMESFNAYSGLGNANSLTANRISYTYDLKGPSIAVDTACSSSLTAFHLAVKAILDGECTQAIAGGVNALLSPGPTITLSQFGMMSPVGRCKTFDASADGYVRAEGCGLVMLKRRSAAVQDGDPILATVLATATGQDGKSNGITSPDGEAQHRLIARTLAAGNIDAATVSYIEAHGTGTALGDPVEMEQLVKIYGQSGHPCYVGAVKANIGHLEAGAGIAGIIKSVLMLQHGKIPPQPHLQKINPRIHLEGSRLKIASVLNDWAPGIPRRAAVSSFGFGGALAHAILEEAVPTAAAPASTSTPFFQAPFVFSAHSPEGLHRQADNWIDFLGREPVAGIHDLCYTQATMRTDLRYRLTFLADTKAVLLQKLKAFREGIYQPNELLAEGLRCFIFSGQGDQYMSMGRELYFHFPAFRRAFDRCAAAAEDPAAGYSLTAMINGKDEGSPIMDHEYQPILFAVQYALGILLEEAGCVPDILLGHSIGEYAAACLAGCFEPETGILLLKKRTELLYSLPRRGSMLTVFADKETVSAAIAAYPDICIAGINSPAKTVISGGMESLNVLAAHFKSQQTGIYQLKVSQAFHSHYMEPMLETYREYLQQFTFSAPARRWVSSCLGREMTTAPDADYWVKQTRQAVNFRQALMLLAGEPIREFVEIGPGGNTLLAVSETIDCSNAQLLRTLNFRKGDRTEAYFLLEALCKMYTAGAQVHWEQVIQGQALPAGIPGQAFQHKRYWLEGLSPDQLTAFANPSRQPHSSRQVLRNCFYQVNWNAAGNIPASIPEEILHKKINWIVAAPPGDITRQLLQQLKASQKSVYWFSTGEGDSGKYRADYQFDARSVKADYRRALDKVVNLQRKENEREWKIIYADAGIADIIENSSSVSVSMLVPFLQAVKESALVMPLWLLTRQAQPVPAAGDQLQLNAATLWGFGKTLFLEHPEWRGGMIDIASAADVPALLYKVMQPGKEHCVSLRNGQQYITQLQPLAEVPTATATLRNDGAYIITGGFGGLGLACAQWLAGKGVSHLVLTGRRQLPPADTWAQISDTHPEYAVIKQLLQLQQEGVHLDIHRIDVRDAAAMADIFRQLDNSNIPVRGVLHAAGVNWFAKVMDLDNSQLSATLKIKTDASWQLHQLTKDRDLDCFLLFSSVSALWGSVDLSHYTAANYYMDMLAKYRAGMGLPATSINWGPWAEAGMSAGEQETHVLEQLGFRLMSNSRALACMDTAIAKKMPLSLIADIDWEKFRLFTDFSLQPSLFTAVTKGSNNTQAATNNLDNILGSTPEKARAQIEEVVRMELRMVMLIESMDTIDARQRFNFLGMDSLMAISFVAKLEQYFHCKLPATLAYNYPTIEAVSDFIFSQIYENKEGVNPVITQETPVQPAAIPKAFVSMNERPQAAKVRLYCFPYAGSGASAFTRWADAFGDDLEIIAVQPRGREERSHEPAFTALPAMITDLLNDYSDPEGTFYFFGHSMGALVAYEFYAALQRSGRKLPAGLILSGCGAPLAAGTGTLHQLNETAFIEEVLKSYGDPGVAAERRKALQHTSELLRADLQVLECYEPNGAAINVPLTVVAGVSDPLAPPAEVRRWMELSTNDFSICYLKAGHDLVQQKSTDLIKIISAAIK